MTKEELEQKFEQQRTKFIRYLLGSGEDVDFHRGYILALEWALDNLKKLEAKNV